MVANGNAVSLSIIVPVLNEEQELPEFLQHLLLWKNKTCEVILVDGGSVDNTVSLARAMGFTVVSGKYGRALQMNAGAAATTGCNLLFLHADTYLPNDADKTINHVLKHQLRVWGRFNVQIMGDSLMLPIIAELMNLRSKITGIATGDQAMFMTREAFNKVEGFPALPLMEDITMSARLKTLSAPCCIKSKVTTSGRRWEKKGVWRTILLMWRLRFAYWRGVSPHVLVQLYR